MALTLLLAALPIGAHHGATGFDQKPVHLTGKVGMVDWVNPHIVIHMDAAGADGRVAEWRVFTIPPASASRRGFAKRSFEGAEITVDGYQASDGTNVVNATSIVFPDGKTIIVPDCFVDGQYCFTPRDIKVR